MVIEEGLFPNTHKCARARAFCPSLRRRRWRRDEKAGGISQRHLLRAAPRLSTGAQLTAPRAPRGVWNLVGVPRLPRHARPDTRATTRTMLTMTTSPAFARFWHFSSHVLEDPAMASTLWTRRGRIERSESGEQSGVSDCACSRVAIRSRRRVLRALTSSPASRGVWRGSRGPASRSQRSFPFPSSSLNRHALSLLLLSPEGRRALPSRSLLRSRADGARCRTCDDESARAPRSLPSLSLGRWRDLCGSLAPLSLSQPWAFRLWPENLGPELVLWGGERGALREGEWTPETLDFEAQEHPSCREGRLARA